jgi:hypothetical protein
MAQAQKWSDFNAARLHTSNCGYEREPLHRAVALRSYFLISSHIPHSAIPSHNAISMSCISCVIFVAASLSSFHPTFAYSNLRICCVCNSSCNVQSFLQVDHKGKSYLFYRSFHNISYNPYISLLAQTVDSRNRLSFNHWIPLRFQDVNTVCHCQIQPGYITISCSSFQDVLKLTRWRPYQ